MKRLVEVSANVGEAGSMILNIYFEHQMVKRYGNHMVFTIKCNCVPNER